MKKLTESVEDYLEAMLISKEKKGKIKASFIADFLGITRPAVTKAVKSLEEGGYITKSGTSIELTAFGQGVANKVYEKHLKCKEFLIKLGVCEEVADVDCCKIEHCISDDTFKAIKNFCNK